MHRITPPRVSRRRLLRSAVGLAAAATLSAPGQPPSVAALAGEPQRSGSGASTGQETSDTAILSPELRRVIESPQYAAGRWGLLVVDLASGEHLYQLAPATQFRTGSTAKIFSVAAALGTLGAGYRFTTPIVRSGEVSPAGVLAGDLILVASGDLTLGGRTKADGTVDIPDFDHTDANALPGLATLTPENPLGGLDDLARQVAAAGVKQVSGDVLIDDRLWEPVQIGGVPIAPIVVNDNLIDLLITPGSPGAAATVEWRPRTVAYQVDAQVATVESGGAMQIDISAPAAGRIQVGGTIPAGTKPLVQTYQVEDPAAFARGLFIEALGRAGVTVDASPLGANPVTALPAPEAVRALPLLAQFVSPPFAEYAKLINKVSHNLGANLLPPLLAVQSGRRTYAAGMELERAYVRGAGIDPSLFTLVDGQGLADNRVAPQAQVQFLRYLTGRQYFEVFFSSTPIIGVDGSLVNVIPPTDPARGHIFAKTGSLISADDNGNLMLQTKALAGYIDSAQGRRLAFALYLNDVPVQGVADVLAANGALGEMAAAIYAAQKVQ